MKKVMLFLLVHVLAVTALTAQSEGPGEGESVEGYCSNLEHACADQCVGALASCNAAISGTGWTNPICSAQYDACYDECWGQWGDFWCGYRQV